MVNTLGDITLIALAVIYIPIIVIIVKRWKAKATRFIVIPLAVVLLPVMYFLIFFNLPYYELMPFEGKVVDTETKQPIHGAAVLAVYYDEAITIAGTNSYPIDARETLTDERGEFKIPEVKEWFGERLGTVVDAKLTIFKPGYGAFPHHKASKAASENKTWLASNPSISIMYELPKLKTSQERKDNVIFLENYALPLYLGAVNEERLELGLRTIPMPEKKKDK